MAAGGIHAGRGCSPQSENGKRAVGGAGPYGVRDRRHDEIRVGVGIVAAGGHAGRGSGSGDRSAGDPVRNLFAPQLQLDEREIQKPMVFGGVLFHISFAVERNMAAGGIHAGRGCSPQSENGKRAVGGAGPYGVRDRRHDEIRVGVGIVAAGGHAGRGSGSGDRSAGDPVRNLFAPQLQLDEREIQKPMVFGGVLFHISFAVERNMATGGINAGRGCNPQSENGKRAVGDAGSYGVRDRRHGEIRVGGVCPLGAVKRGTRERVAFSGGL